MINLTIVGLGKWGLELVKSVNKNSKIVKLRNLPTRCTMAASKTIYYAADAADQAFNASRHAAQAHAHSGCAVGELQPT